MKKFLYLFILAFTLQLGAKTCDAYDKDCELDRYQAGTESYDNDSDNGARRKATESSVNCSRCCSEGAFVNEECSRECGSCILYNDRAASESRNFPLQGN